MNKLCVFLLVAFSASLLTAAPITFDISANEVVTDGTAITTTDGVIKRGPGRLVLTGNNASTLDGGFSITDGTVDAQNINALGTNSTLGVTVAAGAALNLNAAGTYIGLNSKLSGAGTVNVLLGTGSGSTEIKGDLSDFTGVLNIGNGTGGKFNLYTATGTGSEINLRPNATLYVAAGSGMTIPATITLNGGVTGENFAQLRLNNSVNCTGNITLNGDVQPSSALMGVYAGYNSRAVIYGAIGEAGGSRDLTVNGRDTLALFGANTFTGGTYVRNNITTSGHYMTLELGHTQALGINNADKPVVVEANTRLLLNNVTITGRTLTLNGQGSNPYPAALSATAGTGVWAGPVLLNTSDVRIGVPAENAVLEVAGMITSASGTSGLIINNSAVGTVRLSGANTYAGTTTFVNGTLQLGIDEAIPGNLLLGGGPAYTPTLDLNGFNQSFPQLVGSLGDTLVNTDDTPSTLTINGPFTFKGKVQGKINIVKTGAGEIRLTNPLNSFEGTVNSESGDIRIVSFGDVTVSASGMGAVVDVKKLSISPGIVTSTEETLGIIINGAGAFPTFINDTSTFGGILAENGVNSFYFGNDAIDTAFNGYEGTGSGQNGKWFLGSTVNGAVNGIFAAAEDNTYRLGGGGGTLSINTANALHDTATTNWTDETQTIIESITVDPAAVIIGSTAVNGQGTVVYNNVTHNHTGETTVNADSILQYYSSIAGNTAVTVPATSYSGAGTIQLNLNASSAANFYMDGDFTSFTGTLEIFGSNGHKLNSGGGTLQTGSSMLIRILPGGQFFTGGNRTFSNNMEISGTGNTENRGAIRWDNATLRGKIGLNGDATIGSSTDNNSCFGSISNNVATPSRLTIGTVNLVKTSRYYGEISDGMGPLSITLANGTALFYATNSFTGNLLINSGLQLAGGGTLGAGPVINNGTLTLNNTADLTFANAISGGGAIVKDGAATTTLNGTNFIGTGTITINAGKLLFAVPTGQTVTLANTITGSGTIGVTGGGTLDLPNKAPATGIEGDVTVPFVPVNTVGATDAFDDAGNLTVTSTAAYLGGIGTSYVPTEYPVFTNNTATYGGVLLQNFNGSFFADQSLNDSTFNYYLGTGNGQNGHWFLGASTIGNVAAVMTPCADGNYRLGGGGGKLNINSANALTGARNVIIGSLAANGRGTVVYNNVFQNYTGTTTIRAGSTLEFYSTAATPTTPASVFFGDGCLRVRDATAGNYMLTGDFTAFTGVIEIATSGGQKLNTDVAGLNFGSTALIRVVSGGQLFFAGTHVPELYCNLEIAGTGNNESRGAVRWRNKIYGNIGLNATAYMGPETEGTGAILYGNVSNNTTTAGLAFCIGHNNAKSDSQIYGIISDGKAPLAFQQGYGGTCTLWATNTYTGRTYVDTGSNLRMAGQSSIGPGLLELAGSTGQFIADLDEDRTMSNKLSNGGKFTKRGTKDLVLDGDLSGFTGYWNVEGGKLIIDVSGGKSFWVHNTVTCSNGGQFIVRGNGKVILGSNLRGDVGAIVLEEGAEMAVSGVTRALPGVTTTDGIIAGGVQLLSGTIYPGGQNTIGLLATERILILAETTVVMDLTVTSGDRIDIPGTGITDLSNLTFEGNVLSGTPAHSVVMTTNGSFIGTPKSKGSYVVLISIDKKSVSLVRMGTLMIVR